MPTLAARRRGSIATLFALTVATAGVRAEEDNWPQWRGPSRNGVSSATGIPVTWSERDNLLWRVPIEGRGHSSPVVWGERIFLTTDLEGEVIPGASAPTHVRAGETYQHPASTSADRRHTLVVLCLDTNSGRTLWSETVHDGRVFDNRHRVNTYASPTAVTDGEHVYFYFGSQGLYAYTVDGERVWDADFGDIATWGHGHGTSPLLHGETLILQIDQNEGDGSFLVGVDKRTGRERFRTPRRERINYSSPILVDTAGRAEVVTTSYENVIAYDPETGQERWRSPGFLGNAVPTAVASETMVFVVSGYPDKLTRAIRLPTPGAAAGPITAAWEYRKGSGYTPSPLLHDGYLYLVSDKGILTCLDPDSGAVVYEGGRIPVATFVRASPIAWEDKILLAGEDGDVFVVRAGPKHEILGQSSIGERVIASPAIAGGRLFLRGESHLYAVGHE